MKGILTSLAVLSLFACAVATAQESPAQPVSFRIGAQSLDSALVEFSQQSGFQLVVTSDTIRGKSTRGVKGNLTPTAALTLLLEGLGLEYSVVNPRSLAIRPVSPGPGAPGQKDSADNKREHSLMLARTGEDRSNRPSAQGEAQVETPADESRGIPEILVKGKRSLNADIQRTEDAPQPYVVFGSAEVQRSQALNLEDFLRTRLPMNAAAGNVGQATGTPYTVSGISLRGLGTNQTLILVDGRRMPGFASNGTLGQADLNGIPLAMVERIEVLPSTASGIYGGGATGGVVNVILRRDFNGLGVGAAYANTFDTDSGSLRLDANAGFSLENGRTRITVAASHSDANDLLVGDRDFATRALALQYANNPAAITGSGTPPLRGAVNIRSTGGPLVLDAAYGGGALGSIITHIPLGYAGPASDSGAALRANAGRYNLDMPGGVLGLGRGLIAAPSMKSLALNVRREFGERLEAFVDLSTLGNRGSSYAASVPNVVIGLQASAPNNPFQQNINVRFPTPGLSLRSRSESDVVRATGGLVVRLPRNWTGAMEYGWSRSRSRAISTGLVVDAVGQCVLGRGVAANVDPDGAGPLTPCAPGDSRPALNVLQEGNAFPIDFTPYLLSSPNQFLGPYDTVLKDATLRFSGPLAELPGGPMGVSMLIERRKEGLQDAFAQDIDAASGAAVYTLYPLRSQDANSYYLETRVPVVRELELQVSVRRDDYKTRSEPSFGLPVPSRDGPFPALAFTTSRQDSTDYTVGLRYSPVSDITLRASMGTGFVPPSVTQIAPSQMQFAFPLGNDPKRGNTSMYVGVPYTLIQGGSPDLDPEHSESLSAGAIFTPRFAPGLRLSVDYTRIDKTDEIQTPSFQFMLDNEDAFPGRIARGARLAGDPVGWAGPVTLLNVASLNLARSSVKVCDIQADYTLQTRQFGEFNVYAIGAWQPDYKNQLQPGAPVVQSVGFSGGPLKWRGNFGVDWSRNALTLSWNAQYYDAYRVYSASASSASIATNILNQGSAWIPNQIYNDVIATYRFDGAAQFFRGLLADSEISLGIQNVLGHTPPVVASTSPANAGYSTYGDPRLRRYSFSIRRNF